MRHLIAILLLLATGCTSAPRPNLPPELTVTRHESKPDGSTVESKAVYTGAENTTRSPAIAATPDSFTVGEGTAVEFSDWDVQALPYVTWIIIGSLFAVAGGGMLYLRQPTLAIAAFAVGGVMIVLPLIGGVVKILALIAGTLAVLAGLGYAAYRLGLLDKLIGPAAQAKLLSEGDAKGAAAAAYAYAGGGAKGKVAARKVAARKVEVKP